MMVQSSKTKPVPPSNRAAIAGRLGATVPAAWPSGMNHLTQAYVACQRCAAEEACTDWLAGTPSSIQVPPEFCPDAAGFGRINTVKSRG